MKPGPRQSPERQELETVPCTFCRARPGQPCLTPSGKSQGSKLAHAPRRHTIDPLPSAAHFLPPAQGRQR